MDTGEIKKAFSGDRGKILVLIGAGGALYLWWTRARTPSTPQDVTGPDGLHAPGAGSAPGGSTGSGEVPGPAAPDSGRPKSNAEWLDKAVKILSNPPWNYSATGVWNAIMKAFEGSPISPMEENWIRAAMSALGSPPEGMPPLNITAPTPPPQQPPPPPPPPTQPPTQPPADTRRRYTVVSGDTLWGIAGKMYGNPTRYMDIYWANEATIVSAARAHGVNKDYAKHIYPGTVLVIP